MKSIKNQVLHRSGEKPILADVFYREEGKPKPVVVFSHGFKGYKDWGAFNAMATYFAERGFVFVKFNFSHNGGTLEVPADFPDLESFAQNTYSKELTDLRFVIDWVCRQTLIPQADCDLDAVYLMGHSRGGSISLIQAAEDDRVKKLITLAAVSDFSSRFPQGAEFERWKAQGRGYILNSRTQQQLPIDFSFYEDFVQHAERLNIERAAAHLHIPFLIVHGMQDQTVTASEARDLHCWAPHSELHFIEGASHSFDTTQPQQDPPLPEAFLELLQCTTAFFNKPI